MAKKSKSRKSLVRPGKIKVAKDPAPAVVISKAAITRANQINLLQILRGDDGRNPHDWTSKQLERDLDKAQSEWTEAWYACPCPSAKVNAELSRLTGITFMPRENQLHYHNVLAYFHDLASKANRFIHRVEMSTKSWKWVSVMQRRFEQRLKLMGSAPSQAEEPEYAEEKESEGAKAIKATTEVTINLPPGDLSISPAGIKYTVNRIGLAIILGDISKILAS